MFGKLLHADDKIVTTARSQWLETAPFTRLTTGALESYKQQQQKKETL